MTVPPNVATLIAVSYDVVKRPLPYTILTTPGSSDSATLCRDLDPAELASSAALPVLGMLDKNEPLALVPNSKSDIFDKETKQRRNTGGEGDGTESGNTSPHEQDDAAASSLTAEGVVNALSDSEEETVRNINSDPLPCLGQGRSSGRIDIRRDNEFDSHSTRSDESSRRPVPPSGSDHPHLAMAQRRSANTSFKHLRVIAEHSWTVLTALRGHIPLIVATPRAAPTTTPRADCLHRFLPSHIPQTQRCGQAAVNWAGYLVIVC
jgi:hypothetical protein